MVVMWRPDIGKYTAHLQRAPAPGESAAPTAGPGASCNVIPQVASFEGLLTGGVFAAWLSDPFNRGPLCFSLGGDASVCAVGELLGLGASWVTTPGPAGVGLLPVYEGMAPTNAVTSTRCNETCAFIAPSLMATGVDLEFGFEKAQLPAVVADIRALIAQDLRGTPGWYASSRCLPPGYYVLRFGRAPASLLSHAAGMREPVYIQHQVLASRAGKAGTPPSRYPHLEETFEQLMGCKFGARLHTGKNFARAFTSPRCPLAPRYRAALGQMAALQDRYDPARVFEPELWRKVAAGEGYTLKPCCTLDRSCYCEADIHCPEGFACKPSIAHPQFKACRPLVMN